MYKSGYKDRNAPTQQIPANPTSYNSPQSDLFSQNVISAADNVQNTEYRKEIIVEQPLKQPEIIENKTVIYQKVPERKVSKIIIYYTDNTFETFNADNKPL